MTMFRLLLGSDSHPAVPWTQWSGAMYWETLHEVEHTRRAMGWRAPPSPYSQICFLRADRGELSRVGQRDNMNKRRRHAPAEYSKQPTVTVNSNRPRCGDGSYRIPCGHMLRNHRPAKILMMCINKTPKPKSLQCSQPCRCSSWLCNQEIMR